MVQPHRYVFTRDLDQTPYGSRHLVLRADHNTSHLLHRLNKAFPSPSPGPQRAAARERFLRAMELLQHADEAHILPIDEYGWDQGEAGPGASGGAAQGAAAAETEGIGPFVISDYTGDADGVVTLERLITLKGGWLTLEESKRAIEQLMGASVAAQAAGLAHGPLSMSQVHVDRRGSLLIELYGLPQVLSPTKTARGDEVRSIAEIGYQLVTGLRPIKPVIPCEHMVEHIDQTWRDYFLTGLGPPGYSTAAHALAAVQGLRIAGGGGIGGMGSSLRDLVKSLLAPVR
jgi:hypothetical protein